MEYIGAKALDFFFNLYFLKRNNRVLTSNVHVMRVDAVTVYKIDMKIEQLKTTSYFAQKMTNFFHRKTISLIFFPTLRVRVLLSPYHRALDFSIYAMKLLVFSSNKFEMVTLLP